MFGFSEYAVLTMQTSTAFFPLLSQVQDNLFRSKFSFELERNMHSI